MHTRMHTRELTGLSLAPSFPACALCILSPFDDVSINDVSDTFRSPMQYHHPVSN